MPRRAVNDISAYLARLEPERITSAQATVLFGLFAELTRLGSAGQVLLGPRVAQSDAWKNEGHRSAASWVAKETGRASGMRSPRSRQPNDRDAEHLRRAFAAGARDRGRGAALSRGELLEAAPPQQGWQCQGPAVRSAVQNAVRGVREPFFRHWSDRRGSGASSSSLPMPGQCYRARVRANELFDQAERSQSRGRRAAVARHRARAAGEAAVPVVHVRVDATALRRGYVEHGEVCEIAGVGPVPVSTARSLLPESFLKIVVVDGVDVLSVCHVGRRVTAHVRSAIEARDPTCVVPGCDVAMGLEIDHWQTDYGDGGPTALSNLARLCHIHHAMKTVPGLRVGGWSRQMGVETARGVRLRLTLGPRPCRGAMWRGTAGRPAP